MTDNDLHVVVTADGTSLTAQAQTWLKNYDQTVQNRWYGEGFGQAKADAEAFYLMLVMRYLPPAGKVLPLTAGAITKSQVCGYPMGSNCFLYTRDDRSVSQGQTTPVTPSLTYSLNWTATSPCGAGITCHFGPSRSDVFVSATFYQTLADQWGRPCNSHQAPGLGSEKLVSTETVALGCGTLPYSVNGWVYLYSAQWNLTLTAQPKDPNVPVSTWGANYSSDWSHTLAVELQKPANDRIRNWIAHDINSAVDDPYYPAMAARFQPILRFDSGEPWRPLDVDQFFAERDTNGDPAHQICPPKTDTDPNHTCLGINNSSDLNTYPTGYIDVYGSTANSEGHYGYAAPGCDGGQTVWDCDPSRQRIYYSVSAASPGGFRYIDYWAFYRFNWYDDQFGGNHEGDWEDVSIASSLGDPNAWAYATFSQHGQYFSYLRGNLQCDDNGAVSCGSDAAPSGTRLVVFPAKGDHANYGDQCYASCIENAHTLLGEQTHDGAMGWVANYDPSTLLPFPSGWTDWPGMWGNPDESNGVPGAGLDDPPISPGRQSHFVTPWSSACATNNDGCAHEARGRRLSKHDPRRSPAAHVGACRNWFGPDVAALVCARAALRTTLANWESVGTGLRLTRLRVHMPRGASTHRDRTDSVRGLAQLVGAPLQEGEALNVGGRAPRGAVLFVRVRNGRATQVVSVALRGSLHQRWVVSKGRLVQRA